MAELGLQRPQRTAHPPRTRSVLAGASMVVALCALAAACAANPESTAPADPLSPSVEQRNVVAPPPAPARPPTEGSAGLPSTFQQAATKANIAGCEVFPRDHYMNATNIDRLPTHPRSADWMKSLGGAGTGFRLPRSTTWEGSRAGMPLNVVDSRQIGFSQVLLDLTYTAKAYRGGYPVPPNPLVQGHPVPTTDQHMIMVDVADCTVYETIGYEPQIFQIFGVHSALSGTRYRLDTTEQPIMTTNAPNTPMVGQYVMRHEVEQRSVPHVLAFCSDTISRSHVWPARKSDGRVDGDGAMPMGAWIRLGGDVDLTRFHGEARPIAEALRRHGAVLTDSCGHSFWLQLENSDKWNDAELNQLRALTVEDFEVVDSSHLMVDPGTFAIR